MTKLYNYEEFIFSKEINENENLKIKCIFEDNNIKSNKILLLSEFINLENNKYLVETKIYKYIDNDIVYNGNYSNNYIMKDNDIVNIELLVKIFSEINTTNLNEYISGYKDLKYNTISFKLWKKDNKNFYIGITTSYEAENTIYDYIIVGGGVAGAYSAYKIGKENPNSNILVIEENSKTFNAYLSDGYDKVNKWSKAQNDNDYFESYLSNNNKFVWLGKGLGGGSLIFGLQYTNNISKNYEEWKKENYNIIDNDLKAIQYKYEKNEKTGTYLPNKSWYDLKNNLDLYSLENNINVYNNTIYTTNYVDRLLVGNLLNDLNNVKIIYGKKIDKMIFKNMEKKEVESIKTFDDIYYRGKNIILCAGALETPCILQRSMIDCGNKLYDHGGISGLAYGKLESIDPDKLNENKSKMLDPNLGFEPNKIVGHLQTRDKNFNWQTYYSTVPGINDLLILTHAQSINLNGKNYVKIKSSKNESPNILLDYFGNNKNEVIDNLMEAYNINNKFLNDNGYILVNPNPVEKPITREFIENNIDSIYHYHGSCAVGEVVDKNQRVYNINNLYIGDISVLPKPWAGSTSYAALNTALIVSKNFFK